MAPARQSKPARRQYEPSIPCVRISTRKRVNLGKLRDESLLRYKKFFNLGEAKSKEQLLTLCSDHFANDLPEPAEVLTMFFIALGREKARSGQSNSPGSSAASPATENS